MWIIMFSNREPFRNLRLLSKNRKGTPPLQLTPFIAPLSVTGESPHTEELWESEFNAERAGYGTYPIMADFDSWLKR